MLRRVLSAAVAFSLATTVVSAAGFETAVRNAVRAAAAQTQQTPASEARPNRMPALVMIGGGLTIAVIGFARPEKKAGTGVEINTAKNKKWIEGVGLGFAGVGGLLLWSGGRKTPSVTLGPAGLKVQKTIVW